MAMSGTGGGLMGSGGEVVEADETYIGRKPGRKKAHAGAGHKEMVFSLVERDGKVRSRHVTNFDGIKKVLAENVSPKARLSTDEARWYRKVAKQFAEHLTVNHSKDEYVRGDASTNAAENFFSTFKRGMSGVYQHCGSQHLHRYLSEFDFRFNSRSSLGIEDNERTRVALKGIEGKRLTYQTAG